MQVGLLLADLLTPVWYQLLDWRGVLSSAYLGAALIIQAKLNRAYALLLLLQLPGTSWCMPAAYPAALVLCSRTRLCLQCHQFKKHLCAPHLCCCACDDPSSCCADALCRYQLVYACGDPQELPWLAERAAAVQAVAHVLRGMVDAAHPAATDPSTAVWQAAPDRCGSSCCGVA